MLLAAFTTRVFVLVIDAVSNNAELLFDTIE